MDRARALRELEFTRDVTCDDARARYRALAMKWHPDKNPGREEECAKKFIDITTAYHVLTTVNFDAARFVKTYVVPPMQTLEDVFVLAMNGTNTEEIEAIMRARGEYRPHRAFGVDVNVPWSAGERPEMTYDVRDSAYTTTRAIEGEGTDGVGIVRADGRENLGDRAVGESDARPWERVGGVGFDGDGERERGKGERSINMSFVGRKDLDQSSAGAGAAAAALNETGARAFDAGEYDVAYEYHAEAVRLAPNVVAYLGNKAAAALKMGGTGETRRQRDALADAVEACEAAIALEIDYARGYARAGKALFILGDRGDGDVQLLRRAKDMLDKALELDPVNAGAKSMLKEVEISLQLFDSDSD